MFESSKRIKFCAAHALVGHPGKCSRIHGHNYQVIVTVRSHQLSDIGISVEFDVIGDELKKIAAEWDHQTLNEVAPWAGTNTPTSAEHVAIIVFQRLMDCLVEAKTAHDPRCSRDAYVHCVEVLETDTTSIRYYGKGV